jgi:hypothetical protein
LADRRDGTIDREVLATNSRGHQNGTKIRCARVSIITVTRLTTALAISLANITPIIVRAVDLKRCRKRHFGKYCVALAIEKVESVIVSNGHIKRCGNSIK